MCVMGKIWTWQFTRWPSVPEAFLVMAGSVASGNDRPFAYYRELAANWAFWIAAIFPKASWPMRNWGNYFAGADFVLLTYASSFHSQSAVLNIAAVARKPVLASASPSPLIESVKNFNLGVTVEPDSVKAIADGMSRLVAAPPSPEWKRYEEAASWNVNARGILAATFKQ